MPDQDVKSIANATGTYAVLQPGASAVSRPGDPAPESGKNTPAVSVPPPDLKALAVKLNLQSQPSARELRFEVDLNSGNSVIQVLDRETGEVIREIPPEKAEISLSVNGEVRIRLYDGQA